MVPSERRGNILISVLWVITIMAILVMGLSYEARGDMERTRSMRDRAKAYWLARGAIERVKYDYAILRQSPDEEDRLTNNYSYTFDEGAAFCEIRSSASTMPINIGTRSGDPTFQKEMWNQMLSLYVDDQQADEISDAIVDWTDEDDLHMLNGAESDYYMGLTPPYPARNGPFYSIEELLLVRGITEEMFYGTWDKPGLADMLDMQPGNRRKFDLNSCSKGILMAFLEITSEEADQLIQIRREEGIENQDEILNYVNVPDPANLNYFFPITGRIFTVRATATINQSPARYTVESGVSYSGHGNYFQVLSHKDFSLEHVGEYRDENEEEQ